MWKEIQQNEYIKLFDKYNKKKELNPIETFTNCYPSRLSYEPQILTVWGYDYTDNGYKLKHHIRNYHQKNEYIKYYKWSRNDKQRKRRM